MTIKDFSIIIIPDTQNIVAPYPEKLGNMTKWIVEHARELNLKFVLHVGDLVNGGELNDNEWHNHKKAFDPIDAANIPMLFAIGNHDYDSILKVNRDSKAFNQYCGVDRFKDKPWYGRCFEEGKAENMYAEMEIAGMPFLFLILECGPRDEVLDWANQVLANHSDHSVIVVTHSYMYIYGERTKPEDDHNPKNSAGAHGANDGEDIWQKCLKHHNNITAVYSGHHVGGHISYRFDLGEQNNLVFQSFQNWQSEPHGGDARIRILRYRLSENRVDLSVFNPQTECYESNMGNETSHPISATESNQEQWLKRRFPSK